jgi:glycosyltransferase involved in cell wall biosynthesis
MLSLAMLARDEADRIEASLTSVADLVDEMVVLDTGSSDDTIAIARRCGAVVHQMAWPGDFAPARNRCLELVQGDWVLVLDADERLRPEAIPPLRALIAEPDLLVVTLLRQELGAAQSPYSSVSRLFRRHPAIRWSGRYHAMVDDSVAALQAAEPHWRIAQCPEPALLHSGYGAAFLADGSKARRLRQAMEAAAAKYFASEMVGRVADRAVQIFGGAGYIADYGIERFYRDVRIFRIYEGTSQIQQVIIARETLKRGG